MVTPLPTCSNPNEQCLNCLMISVNAMISYAQAPSFCVENWICINLCVSHSFFYRKPNRKPSHNNNDCFSLIISDDNFMCFCLIMHSPNTRLKYNYEMLVVYLYLFMRSLQYLLHNVRHCIVPFCHEWEANIAGVHQQHPVLILLLFNEIVCETQCTQMIMLYLLSRVQDHHFFARSLLFAVMIINRQFICSSSMDDANKGGYKDARKQFLFACNVWRERKKENITSHCL